MGDHCPCGSGDPYDDCCGRLHRERQPPQRPTADALAVQRLRLGDRDYLLRTWHPAHAPSELVLDDELRWMRLDVTDVRRGGFLDVDGEVEFTAHYRSTGCAAYARAQPFVRETAAGCTSAQPTDRPSARGGAQRAVDDGGDVRRHRPAAHRSGCRGWPDRAAAAWPRPAGLRRRSATATGGRRPTANAP